MIDYGYSHSLRYTHNSSSSTILETHTPSTLEAVFSNYTFGLYVYYLDSERSSDEEPCTLSHQRDEEADAEEHKEAEKFWRLGGQEVDHRHVDGREKNLQKTYYYLFQKIGKAQGLIKN